MTRSGRQILESSMEIQVEETGGTGDVTLLRNTQRRWSERKNAEKRVVWEENVRGWLRR